MNAKQEARFLLAIVAFGLVGLAGFATYAAWAYFCLRWWALLFPAMLVLVLVLSGRDAT